MTAVVHSADRAAQRVQEAKAVVSDEAVKLWAAWHAYAELGAEQWPSIRWAAQREIVALEHLISAGDREHGI